MNDRPFNRKFLTKKNISVLGAVYFGSTIMFTGAIDACNTINRSSSVNLVAEPMITPEPQLEVSPIPSPTANPFPRGGVSAPNPNRPLPKP